MKFTCEACDQAIEYSPSRTQRAMPSGWKMHNIKGKRLLLCADCGGPGSFSGGIAPFLKELLHEKHGITFDDDE